MRRQYLPMLALVVSLFAGQSLSYAEPSSSYANLARELEDYSKAKFKNRTFNFNTFVISTEMEIGRARPVIEKAPAGAFFSVGSELAFRALAMMPKPELAIFADLDPDLVRFNQINTQLLLAESLEQYRHLRWQASLAEWQKVSPRLTQADHTFWLSQVRDLYAASYYLPEMLNRYETDTNFVAFTSIIEFCHRQTKASSLGPDLAKTKIQGCLDGLKPGAYPPKLPPEAIAWLEGRGQNKDWQCLKDWRQDFTKAINMAAVIDFKTGHYLFDQELYKKLHHLARNGRIMSLQADLKDPQSVNDLVAILKKHQVKIALADLDNLFFKDYLDKQAYLQLVAAFTPVIKPEAIVMVMINYKNFACGQYQTYFGLTHQFLNSWPKAGFSLNDYLEPLSAETVGHMMGKVYDEKNLPPYFSR